MTALQAYITNVKGGIGNVCVQDERKKQKDEEISASKINEEPNGAR